MDAIRSSVAKLVPALESLRGLLGANPGETDYECIVSRIDALISSLGDEFDTSERRGRKRSLTCPIRNNQRLQKALVRKKKSERRFEANIAGGYDK